jgi:hypothetical protein
MTNLAVQFRKVAIAPANDPREVPDSCADSLQCKSTRWQKGHPFHYIINNASIFSRREFIDKHCFWDRYNCTGDSAECAMNFRLLLSRRVSHAAQEHDSSSVLDTQPWNAASCDCHYFKRRPLCCHYARPRCRQHIGSTSNPQLSRVCELGASSQRHTSLGRPLS